MNHKVIMPDIGIPMAKHPHSNNCPFQACIHWIFFLWQSPGPPTLYACLYSISIDTFKYFIRSATIYSICRSIQSNTIYSICQSFPISMVWFLSHSFEMFLMI
eukprot:101204_1